MKRVHESLGNEWHDLGLYCVYVGVLLNVDLRRIHCALFVRTEQRMFVVVCRCWLSLL